MMACIQYILSKHAVTEEQQIEPTSDYVYSMQDQSLSREIREAV